MDVANEVPATVGAMVLKARIEAGLTQEQLAELAGIDRRTLQKLEAGEIGAPTDDTLTKLKRKLRFSKEERAHLKRLVAEARARDRRRGPRVPNDAAADAFAQFFGADMAYEKATLVVADFHCTQGPNAVDFKRPNLNERRISYQTRGLDHVLAYEDFRALRHLLWPFSLRHVDVHMRNDFNYKKARSDGDRSSYISVGLASNDLTYEYLRRTDYGHPLVQIRVGKRSILDAETFSDEPLHFFCPFDKKTFPSRWARKDQREPLSYAMIARFTEPRQPHASIKPELFIVGGLTADGTSTAAYFLANSWPELHDIVEPDTDFVAIIECPWRSPEEGQCVHLYIRNRKTKVIQSMDRAALMERFNSTPTAP